MAEKTYSTLRIVNSLLTVADDLYLEALRSNKAGDIPFNEGVRIIKVDSTDDNATFAFDIIGIKDTDESGLSAELTLGVTELKMENDLKIHALDISVSVNDMVITKATQGMSEEIYSEFKKLYDRLCNDAVAIPEEPSIVTIN